MSCIPGSIYRHFPVFLSIFPFPHVLDEQNAAEKWTSNKHKNLIWIMVFWLVSVTIVSCLCLSVLCFNLSFGSNNFSFSSSCGLSLLRNTNNSYPQLLASLGLSLKYEAEVERQHIAKNAVSGSRVIATLQICVPVARLAIFPDNFSAWHQMLWLISIDKRAAMPSRGFLERAP